MAARWAILAGWAIICEKFKLQTFIHISIMHKPSFENPSSRIFIFIISSCIFCYSEYDSDEFSRLLNVTCSTSRKLDFYSIFKSRYPSRKMIARRDAFVASLQIGVDIGVLKIIMNHENAGFFAYLTFALNQILYAEQNGLFPVVFFGPTSGCYDCAKTGTCDLCGSNAFYDKQYGENSWDYFFEQPGLISLSHIESLQRNGSNITIHVLSDLVLWNIHLREPNAIFTHGYGFYEEADPKTLYYDHDWFESRRGLAHSIMSDYIRFKPRIRARVEKMLLKMRQAPCTLGVHIRATDKGIWGGARKVGCRTPFTTSPRRYCRTMMKGGLCLAGESCGEPVGADAAHRPLLDSVRPPRPAPARRYGPATSAPRHVAPLRRSRAILGRRGPVQRHHICLPHPSRRQRRLRERRRGELTPASRTARARMLSERRRQR